MKKETNEISLRWGDLSKYRSYIYGFTILWIVIFHAWEQFRSVIKVNWVLVDIIKRGNMGVDIFLFMSGISLYFSLKNNQDYTLMEFYKKRLCRIAKLYVLVCIPYFILLFVVGVHNSNTLFKMIFFMNKNINSFWFLMVIAICYLIYPFVFKLINGGKKNYIYIFTAVYIIFLFVFMAWNKEAYAYYEILLSRIPIFLVGATVGDKVYNNDEIPPKYILISLALLVALGPLSIAITRISFISKFSSIILRLFLGVQAISVLLIFVIIIRYIDKLKIMKAMSFLGGYTLEIYIVHIILRGLAVRVLKITPSSLSSIFVFTIFYVILSTFIGWVLGERITC